MMLSSVLPISIAGFVLASYFSAVMSTADSCLIAASGNVKTKLWWTNWLLEGIKENETTQKIAYALIWASILARMPCSTSWIVVFLDTEDVSI